VRLSQRKYSGAECKQILLDEMDRENRQYQSSLEAKSIEPDSWAAITTCYASSDPQVYIKAIGNKIKGIGNEKGQ